MQRISLVDTAHNFIKEILHSGAIAIDATVGNGHDTLFLVKQVGPSGQVFGFDIQQTAIASTRAKFLQTPGMQCLTLIHASHADMSEKIPVNYHGNISVIMFNLGYLPGGDKNIITCTDSTITALHCSCELISSQGIITVMAYPGHPGGDLETAQVKSWCEQLDKDRFKVDIIYSADNKDSAPRLFVIQKRH
ncbi:class I SAM-dependent methyltransferase [Methylobacter sp. S3L5C]|uniref:tRNA (mnm(5)s(2)U34)-methyltransferase n=1 Tax=Methylobacter sp. S3L5C TaxID=2839024 RepID=UPI001FAE390D|nr:class I SAM-dependent methyltransferase [Methylobacter sp. S3L5C]UOA07436.1 methyltransferase domain-containing protein [Methylobacter sp. S3L5C]